MRKGTGSVPDFPYVGVVLFLGQVLVADAPAAVLLSWPSTSIVEPARFFSVHIPASSCMVLQRAVIPGSGSAAVLAVHVGHGMIKASKK